MLHPSLSIPNLHELELITSTLQVLVERRALPIDVFECAQLLGIEKVNPI